MDGREVLAGWVGMGGDPGTEARVVGEVDGFEEELGGLESWEGGGCEGEGGIRAGEGGKRGGFGGEGPLASFHFVYVRSMRMYICEDGADVCKKYSADAGTEI